MRVGGITLLLEGNGVKEHRGNSINSSFLGGETLPLGKGR